MQVRRRARARGSISPMTRTKPPQHASPPASRNTSPLHVRASSPPRTSPWQVRKAARKETPTARDTLIRATWEHRVPTSSCPFLLASTSLGIEPYTLGVQPQTPNSQAWPLGRGAPPGRVIRSKETGVKGPLEIKIWLGDAIE